MVLLTDVADTEWKGDKETNRITTQTQLWADCCPLCSHVQHEDEAYDIKVLMLDVDVPKGFLNG